MPALRHLMFLFVNHFEPESAGQVRDWVRRYREIASRHADSSARCPQHTWFYWGTKPDELAELKGAADAGLGEVEMHLHHGNDTDETLRRKIAEHLQALVDAGLRAPAARIPYGFIHGKWALDNSRDARTCGVNNELLVLRDTGCYADFTFPAWGPMQPRKHNSIYYATDDPDRPKSYDIGIDVEAGKEPTGDLMIFQGPGRISGLPEAVSLFRPLRWLFDRLFVSTDITYYAPPTPARADDWVRQSVHVKGRPDWVFVKVHTHGARQKSYPAYFGCAADRMYSHLEARYNDGSRWRLHYVTAREAYNIVKAAEAGESSEPGAFRDFEIPRHPGRGAVTG